jgi:hypothetical protein
MSLFLLAAGSPVTQSEPAQFRTVCKDLLGMDYPELQRELERYITGGRYTGRKAPRPMIPDKATYAVRPVATAEMTDRLAELSLRFGQSAYANLTIRNALSRQPDIRLHELLGALALQDGETESAREHWGAALELGTTNAAIFRELARLEGSLLFNTFNVDYLLPEARAARLRNLLHKSVACAPAQSMGYEMLAWVEATSRQPDIAAVNLVQQHFSTLNERPRTLLALALVRYRLRETEPALAMLDQLDKMNLNPGLVFCAEILRARLEGRPVDLSKQPAEPTHQPGGMIMRLPSVEPPR